MPKYKMLINAKDFDQMRAAIVNENGLLEQVDFEHLGNDSNLGNIYKATVTAIEPSLQATFVDYGGNRHGFLPFNEIHPRYFLNNDRKANTQDKVRVGQEFLVQVAREEIGLKGAYLTTYLSLPGQYLVMMPLSNRTGISRKIEDATERSNIRKVISQVSVPDGMGYIIRTAGMGKTKEQIQRDLNVLTSTWRELEARSKKQPSPSMIYQEDDVVSRTIRDYFNEDIGEILVDHRGVYETIQAYFRKVLPSYANIVKYYRGKAPIFSKYQLEDQIEKIFSPKIKLPSGGSIVIEQTEALVVIDVNSGKTSEGNLELTAFKANQEAAEEVARQLRIRDLGGLVVIDFIDLRERRNIQDVEKRLRDAIKLDKARITVTPMSRFGLVEMSRQRINTSKEIKHYEDCLMCQGTGRIKTLDTQALDLLRKIKSTLYSCTVKQLTITTGQELGLYLLNSRKKELNEMEERFRTEVVVSIKSNHLGPPTFDITKKTAAEEKKKMELPAPLSLSTMAASMSEKDINERKDYREERLKALEEMSFEELRGIDIPIPHSLEPFDKFNFSVRVSLMKKHGLYENMMGDFKDSVREKVMRAGGPNVNDQSDDPMDARSRHTRGRARDKDEEEMSIDAEDDEEHHVDDSEVEDIPPSQKALFDEEIPFDESDDEDDDEDTDGDEYEDDDDFDEDNMFEDEDEIVEAER